MASLGLGHGDVVIAVAASGSTPFTLAAVVAAREAGALTVGLANNADAPLLDAVDIPVLLDSGPEVIVGSTRMGAGTAQKAALGMISSLAMIRLGHVLDGLMVNLKVDNAKLRRRAIRILVHLDRLRARRRPRPRSMPATARSKPRRWSPAAFRRKRPATGCRRQETICATRSPG